MRRCDIKFKQYNKKNIKINLASINITKITITVFRLFDHKQTDAVVLEEGGWGEPGVLGHLTPSRFSLFFLGGWGNRINHLRVVKMFVIKPYL